MTTATMQELLDYCEMLETEEAISNTLAQEYISAERDRIFPESEGDEYDYV